MSILSSHSLGVIFLLWNGALNTPTSLENWWESLDEDEQESVTSCVLLLEARGPMLGYPFSSGIQESKHSHRRELRVQHAGRPYRVLYAFDPRRVAILLIGGDKTGDDRWYEKHVTLADKIYEAHTEALKKEGK